MVREMNESKSCSDSVKFLCSYSGKILPRRSDGKLRYVGGYTRVLSVDRSVSYAELMVKLVEFCGFSVTLKCQLPSGDLDTLISVKSDEDLANIIEEYDRALRLNPSTAPQKIRAVLASPKSLKSVSPSLSSSSSVYSSGYKSPVSDDGSPREPIGEFVRFRSSTPTFGYPAAFQGVSAKPRCIYVHGAPRVFCSGPCCNYLARHPVDGRRLHTN